VPFEMVDAVLADTGRVEKRVRDLPARVGVYLLLAGVLFSDVGWPGVWGQMVGGLTGLPVVRPCPSSMAASRRRVGVAPVRALFELLAGPVAAGRAGSVFWRGRLVCAVDGTTVCAADSPANLTVYAKNACNHGASGYPLVRLVALVACGTRGVIDAVFGPTSGGETTYAARLLASLRPGMILLADRGFAGQRLLAEIAATGADLLVRVKNGRSLPIAERYPDGSWRARIGTVEVRVVRCQITIVTDAGRTTGYYQLVTTVLDPAVPAGELVRLYHDRWIIETAFLELKATILKGRVLRAKTPDGVAQEIYALLVVYQALRTAIVDAALTRAGVDPGRGSFATALTAARAQVVLAAGVLDHAGDLAGSIGRAVLAALMPDRPVRTSPRIVKRAISPYVASTAKGRFHGPSYKATLSTEIITDDELTPASTA
jgi:hypothetical protein